LAVPPIVSQVAQQAALEAARQIPKMYHAFIEAKREETRLAFQRYVEDMARFEQVYQADAAAMTLKINESFKLIREVLNQGDRELAELLHRTVLQDTSLTKLLIDYHRQVTGQTASGGPTIIEIDTTAGQG
jgi:hypothetical protein